MFKKRGINIHLARSVCGKKSRPPRIINKSKAAPPSEETHNGKGSHPAATENVSIPHKKQDLITNWLGVEPKPPANEHNKENETNTSKEDNDWNEVTARLRHGDRDEVLVHNNLAIRRRDLRSLQNSNWLNDKIIDEYMWLLKRKSDNIEVLSSFLYKKLTHRGQDEGIKDTARWIKDDL